MTASEICQRPSKRLKKDISPNDEVISIRPSLGMKKRISSELLSTERVANEFKSIFFFERFNKMQSECFSLVYGSNENAVISAPTGSGKTVLFELAICRLHKGIDSLHYIPKCIYIAPLKALCQERSKDWKSKFSGIKLKVIELTGDTGELALKEVESSHIILTTPEKWDAFTRKLNKYKATIKNIRLLLIDEVHLLNTTRGSTLEALVSRMQNISDAEGKAIRMIAQSATIPNIEDLCEWLKVDKDIGLRKFGEEFRPIKLQKHVIGFPETKNEFTFERALNFKLAGVIRQYSDNRPTLVFCQTQKGTLAAAAKLKEDLPPSYLIESIQQDIVLKQAANTIKDKGLQGNFINQQ